MTNKEVLQERLKYFKTNKVPPMPDEFIGEGRASTIGAFGFSALAFMYGIIPILLCTTFIVPIFDKSEFVKYFDFFKFISGNGDNNMMMIIFIISIAFGLYGIGAFIGNVLIEQGEDPIYKKMYVVEAQKTLQAYKAMKEEYQQRYENETSIYKQALIENEAFKENEKWFNKNLSKAYDDLKKANDTVEKLTLSNKKKDIKIINQEIEMARLKSKIHLGEEVSTEDPLGGLYE